MQKEKRRGKFDCHLEALQLYMCVWPSMNFKSIPGFLRGSVVKYLTRNPGVLGSSRTGSSRFLVGVSSGKTLQGPDLVLVKLGKDLNNVSCRRDMHEKMLKA